jgi:hypothetical protein
MIDISNSQEDTGTYNVSISFPSFGTTQIDTSSILEFYFIESIDTFAITGKIKFVDVNGVVEDGPLTGTEFLNISYGEKEVVIDRYFSFYKVNEISMGDSGDPAENNVVEIIFTDPNFLLYSKFNYSLSWKDTKISDIVKYIGEKMLKFDVSGSDWEDFEESNEKIDFCMPYWTPQQAINWLIKRASGSESGEAGYLFFNNSKNGEEYTTSAHNFVTLEKLLQQKNLMVLGEGDDGHYVMQGENMYLYNKILSFSINGIDSQGMVGVSGGTRHGYDTKRKKLLTEEFSYTDGVDKTTILGMVTLFNDISNPSASFINTGEEDEGMIENIFFNEWTKRYNLQQTVSIIVKGHEGRYAGGMIEIQWPSQYKDQKFNKNHEGKYLIKSITHHFSNSVPYYKQKLTLIKNGYNDSYAMRLLKSTKKNI